MRAPLLFALLLGLTLLACGPVRHPTPGGLVVFYEPGEKRLSAQKAAELDARHEALLECLPPESFCTTEPPTFSIDEDSPCDDWFLDRGVRVRGYTWMNGTRRIKLPRSLGAAAHEMVHVLTCETDPKDRDVYDTLWLSKCGDAIDGAFRRRFPPRPCPSGYVRPGPLPDDERDVGLRYAEALTDYSLRLSLRGHGSHLDNVSTGNLGHAVHLARLSTEAVPAFDQHISVVVNSSAKKQVGWPHTSAIVAAMQDAEAWPVAVGDSPRYDMSTTRRSRAPTNAYAPIPVLAHVGSPNPAPTEERHVRRNRAILVDLRPETLQRFFIHWNHLPLGLASGVSAPRGLSTVAQEAYP